MINRTSASVLHYEWYLKICGVNLELSCNHHYTSFRCQLRMGHQQLLHVFAACYQFRFKAFLCSPPLGGFGRPLFFLLSGVHLRATFDMLVISLQSMWPIQRHLCFTRTIPVSSFSVSLKNSLLEKIFLRQKIYIIFSCDYSPIMTENITNVNF